MMLARSRFSLCQYLLIETMGNSNHTEMPNKLNQDDIDLLIKRTGFTQEVIEDYFSRFKTICSATGEVDRKAFIEYLQTFRPDKDLEVFGNQLFNAFDANSNGRIDFAEFLVAISFTTNDDPHRKLSFAFKMYDQNHDGQLDVKEIEKIIVGVYDFTGQRNRKGKMTPREVAKSMLRKYDKDESGALTEDEFMSGIADPTLQAMDYFSILRDKMA